MSGPDVDLVVDPGAATPPFEQVRAQLAAAIGDGTLGAGHRLPTVRALAVELDLAANTVARAYRELEAAGLIETRGRQGSFVAGPPDPARAKAITAAQRYVRTTSELGFDAEQSLGIVRHELERR